MESKYKYLNHGLSENQVIDSRVCVKDPYYFPKKNNFLLTTRKYDRQFYSMYQYRLGTLRESVYQNAVEKWGNGVKKIDGLTVFKKDKILDIAGGEMCWVIGTTFSDLKYKLNIFQDVEDGKDDILPQTPESYIGDQKTWTMMIEDESGRAILNNDEFLNKNILVTGCIVAILGIEVQAGIFEIMDVVYPSIAPQRPFPALDDSRDMKIALISGLSIDNDVASDLKIELLKCYLSGELGSDKDKEDSKNTAGLLIAGNSVRQFERSAEDDFITMNNYGTKNVSKFDPESLKKFKTFVNELISSIPITIMPGADDPAEITLPQQPLHKAMFSRNMSHIKGGALKLATNPSWFEIGGLRLLGTSGQNIDDIFKYLPEEIRQQKTSSDIMKETLKWQNIVPTAPDTLYCYPYENCDPFVLSDELPHVYFAGNQSEYSTSVFKKDNKVVRLISIPKFSETGQFVLLNLRTLEPEIATISMI